MTSTLKIDTIQNAGSAVPNITLDTNGNATVGNTLAMGSSFVRNRIINGDMRIDQRNSGASVTPSANVYCVDRWYALIGAASKYSVQQNAGSVIPPTGFTNYVGVTSLSAYTPAGTENFSLMQPIEGYNVADLAFGTASAKTITISFWVRSSLTGTFGCSIVNNGYNRSYPVSYAINLANTWEYKTITIPGDTTGTWTSDNSAGLRLYINLGTGSTYSGVSGAWAGAFYGAPTGATSVVGTNGATFYLTGVQLEVGSTPTAFERDLYSIMLQKCQRYYEKNTGPEFYELPVSSGGQIQRQVRRFAVQKRVAPTVTQAKSGGDAATSVGQDGSYIDSVMFSFGGNQYNYITWDWTASAEL